MTPQFHDDGTPKSLNNAFTIRRPTDASWLSSVRQSEQGRAQGMTRAEQLGSAQVQKPKRPPQNAKWIDMAITLRGIKQECYDDGNCWVWQGAFDGKAPIINRRKGGRERIRVRVWIATNVLRHEPKPLHPVMMRCKTVGCCNPSHILTHNMIPLDGCTEEED